MKSFLFQTIKKLNYRYFGLIVFNFVFISVSQSQSTDTAGTPRWVSEMDNKNVNILEINKIFEEYWKNRPISKSSGYKVYKRWAYMRELEMDSMGFPRNPHLNTKESTFKDDLFGINEIRNIDSSKECIFDTTWYPLGPTRNRDAGRANAIAFHPTNANTLLLGTASGGLWKTTDNGKSWNEINFNGNTKGVYSIAWDQKDTNTIYLGSGDLFDADGCGIFKSTDAGKTWQAINNGLPNSLIITRIIIDPRNSNILLIGTNNGIYRSINSGNNWKKCNYQGDKKIMDLEINPAFSNRIIVTSYDQCFYSVDSGKTYKQSKGINLIGYAGYRGALSTTKSDSSYVYFLLCDFKTFRGLYRSTNFGDSFELMSNTPNLMDYAADGGGSNGQAYYCMDIVVNPTNKNDVYVGGINIFRSINGGRNWVIYAHWTGDNSPRVHADIHRLEFSPITNKIFAACDGGLYTKNTTWESISIGLNTRQAYKISTNNLGIVMAGFQDNGTWYNNSAYNLDFFNQNDGDGMDNAIDPIQNTLYSSFYYGNIYKGFAKIAATGVNGINETGDWITPFILIENDPNIMIAGYKSIWRSSNLNNSINFKNICDSNSISSEFINDIENSPFNNKILYFSRKNGGFFRTNSLNANNPKWINLTSKKPMSGLINDIQCSFLDSSTVYIAINDRIYKSTNQGNNWNNISTGLANVYVYCIAIDSSNGKELLFCGTSNGVYFYVNNTWEKYGKKFPNYIKVTDLEISYNINQSLNSLLASTYGQGIWQVPLPSFKNQNPIAKLQYLQDKTFCVNKSYLVTDQSNGYKMHHEWIYDTSEFSIQYTNLDSNQIRPSFLKSGRNTIKKAVYNCAGSDTAQVDFIVYDIPPNYPCKGKTLFASNPGEYGVKYLQINNVDVISGNTKTKGEYENFICNKFFPLISGKTNRISLVVNSLTPEYVKVYIDLDNNGILKENEVVFNKNYKSYSLDTFYVPNNVTKNKQLLIRVISDYYPIDTNPCPTIYFGQTEDYSGIVFKEELRILTNKNSNCINDTFTLTDNSDGIFNYYFWDFGDGAKPKTATGIGPHQITYKSEGYKSIKLTVNEGLEKTFDSMLFVKNKPKIQIKNLNKKTPLCIGDSFVLFAENLDTSLIAYNWKFNGLSISSNSFHTVSNCSFKDTGFYELIADNTCTSDTFTYHFVELKEKPIVEILVNQNPQCLANNQFILSSKISSSDPFKILWENGDTSKIKTLNFTKIGNQKIKLIANTNNCSDSTEITLVINPNANSTFTFKNTVNLDVQFNPIDTTQSNYIWNFGDGLNSAIKFPIHSFAQYNQDYNVTLKTKNDFNCFDSSIQKINISPNSIEFLNSNSINIYPNPTKSTIEVEFGNNITGPVEFKLFSNIGAELQSSIYTPKNNSSLNIDLCNLPSGWYILYLKINNDYQRFRIIKE